MQRKHANAFMRSGAVSRDSLGVRQSMDFQGKGKNLIEMEEEKMRSAPSQGNRPTSPINRSTQPGRPGIPVDARARRVTPGGTSSSSDDSNQQAPGDAVADAMKGLMDLGINSRDDGSDDTESEVRPAGRDSPRKMLREDPSQLLVVVVVKPGQPERYNLPSSGTIQDVVKVLLRHGHAAGPKSVRLSSQGSVVPNSTPLASIQSAGTVMLKMETKKRGAARPPSQQIEDVVDLTTPDDEVMEGRRSLSHRKEGSALVAHDDMSDTSKGTSTL